MSKKDTKDVKTKLIRITVFMIAGAVILFAIASASLLYIVKTMHETTRLQLRKEAVEYTARIHKQIKIDFETLRSIAAFIEYAGSGNKNTLLRALATANKQNSFISLAYFSADDGQGVIHTLGVGGSADFPVERCAPAAQATIRQALSGTSSVSEIFKSSITGADVYAYAIPVYRGGKLAGVLAATNRTEIFTDILNSETVMGGNGYIHIINSDGTFLIRSARSIIQDGSHDSIFEGSYIAKKSADRISAALKKGEPVSAEFRYQGADYYFFLQPVGVNGWYLFCADTLRGKDSWGAVSAFHSVFIIIGVATAAILILTNTLFFHGYSLLRKSYAEILRLAYYDQVTGAENIWRFQNRLDEHRKKGTEYSIAALNIRNFKFMNELYGVQEGNKILCYIKSVIEKHLDRDEFFCRDSADLFYILLNENNESIVKDRLSDIIRQVSERTRREEYGHEIQLYCGVAVNGDMVHALLAMQSIKGNYQKNIVFGDNTLYKTKEKESRIESRMQMALKNSEFKLFLQPKICFASGTLASAEALVRWQIDGEYIPPKDFIPLFERNGFCTRLDMYMVENVCRYIRNWLNKGITPIPVSINQSKLLFHEKDYVENLYLTVSNYHIPPTLITLEILEGLADDDPEEINLKIRGLHEKGFRVSMDDFGTGYSSLNILSKLEIDELKLDQAFLREASGENKRRWIILEQIIQMAQKLGISTVAEGLETEEDALRLASVGCDYGQGYFYSKPLNTDAFDATYMNHT